MTASVADDLIDKLKVDKAAIETNFSKVKDQIMDKVKTLFDAKGNTYDDIKDAIVDWYNKLDDYQRDQFGDWHSNESKPIIQSVKEISDIGKTLLEDIPASQSFGLGRVSDWNRNRTSEYIQKLREGKEHVEKITVVPAPEWKIVSPDGTYKTGKKEGRINYRGDPEIEISVPNTAAKIFVTSNGEDPSRSDAQREEVTSSYRLSADDKNMTVKMVAFDNEGYKSPIVVLNLINEYRKHEFELADGILTNMDVPVNLVFPKDAQSLSVTAHSLFEKALEKKIVGKAAVVKLLRELLNKFG